MPRLLLLLLILTLTPSARAMCLTDLLVGCLKCLVALLPDSDTPQTAIRPSDKQLSALRAIQEKKAREDEADRLNWPRSLKVGDATYTVLQRLGGGIQGEVYRVRGPQGNELALKTFKNADALEFAEQGLAALAERQIRTPGVVKKDGNRHILLMELIDGVTIKSLAKAAESDPALYSLWKRLRPIAENISAERGDRHLWVHMDNMVYDLATGQIVVIDPF